MENNQTTWTKSYKVLGVMHAVMMIVIYVSMFLTRSWAHSHYTDTQNQEQSHWDEFRQAVTETREDENAPVLRKVPKSEEPPTAILFRDHFWMLLAAATIFPSILFWATGLMFVGAFLTPYQVQLEAEEEGTETPK
ncbi:MAG: hypothetical protein ACKVH8_14395 [Pirellulales bacterium]